MLLNDVSEVGAAPGYDTAVENQVCDWRKLCCTHCKSISVTDLGEGSFPELLSINKGSVIRNIIGRYFSKIFRLFVGRGVEINL